MRALLTLITTTLLISFTGQVLASDIQANLKKQVSIIETISPFVERVDMSRLLVIKNTVNSVTDNILENEAAGRPQVTFQTMSLIQNMIIQYRFSQVFFGWSEPVSITAITTEHIKPYLDDLEVLTEKIRTDFGFNDAPYTQITANTFRQMQKLLKHLEELAIDDTLKKDLRALWRPIGETIAIASQGDRPRAFDSARLVIQDLRALYPYFDEVGASAAGFSSILELQGLAEFYAEFAQMDF